MSHVDGFVIALPKKNLPACAHMARVGANVWKEHGALDYKECVGDDLRHEAHDVRRVQGRRGSRWSIVIGQREDDTCRSIIT
jgi:uncharacterized protein YbaA (DUF1428 family)